MKYDVLVIGGGAAGISAALWCDELGLKTLLLEAGTELGGQLLRVYNPIKNHLGIETADGREMRDVFLRQIENRRFEIRLQSEIAESNLKNKSVKLENGEEFFAANLILATGVRRRKLDIAGEDEFRGKGILESGKREAESVKDKNVCIVGGGDAAFENALILAETAARVTLVHRRREFSARPEFVEPAKRNRKIEILTETTVRSVLGGARVEAVELADAVTGVNFQKNVEAILIRVGVEPNTDFLRGQIGLDEQGYIRTDQNCATDLKGIYAVGDAANRIAPTVSGAVGTGATAAKAIYAESNSLKNSTRSE